MKIFAFSTPLFMAALFSQANSVRLTTEITTQWMGDAPIMESGGWWGLSYHGKGSSHELYEYRWGGRKIITPSWDTYNISSFCNNASYAGSFRDGSKYQCNGHYNEQRLAQEQQQREQAAAEAQALQKKRAAEAKAAEEKRLQDIKAAEAKAAEEKRLQEIKAAEAKAAEEKRLQEIKAAEAKAAEEKRLQEIKAAEAKAAEEKRLQDIKDAEAKAAEEKRLQEIKAAEAKAAEEKRRQDIKAAEEKAISEQLAQAKTKGWINPAVKPVENDCEQCDSNDLFEEVLIEMDKVIIYPYPLSH